MKRSSGKSSSSRSFYLHILKETGQVFKREIAFYHCILKHPRTPRLSRWMIGIAVAYAVMPFDIVPDFIPVLGQVDDLVIVPGLVILARKMIPDDVIAECRRKALAKAPKSDPFDDVGGI